MEHVVREKVILDVDNGSEDAIPTTPEMNDKVCWRPEGSLTRKANIPYGFESAEGRYIHRLGHVTPS